MLKPDGIFVGACAQNAAFHNSYINHTSWGLIVVAEASGLKVTRIWAHWDTLRALAYTASYPKAIRVLLDMVAFLHERLPILAPRRWLRQTQRDRDLTKLHQAESICFCMMPTGAG